MPLDTAWPLKRGTGAPISKGRQAPATASGGCLAASSNFAGGHARQTATPCDIPGPRAFDATSRGFTLIELVVVLTIVAVHDGGRAAALRRSAARRPHRPPAGRARRRASPARRWSMRRVLARRGIADTRACPAGGGIADNRLDGARHRLHRGRPRVARVHGYPALGDGPAGIVSAPPASAPCFNPSAAQLLAPTATRVSVGRHGDDHDPARRRAAARELQLHLHRTARARGPAATFSPVVTTGC